MSNNIIRVFLMFSLVLAINSCVSFPVDKAFDGGMEKNEETKTIVEYCQSCHLHRDFASSGHLSSVTASYKNEPYKSADRCVTCHSIDRDFWNGIKRYTHFPDGRLVAQ